MIEALVAKILGSKVALVAGGAFGGVVVKAFWPKVKSMIGLHAKKFVGDQVKGLLDKDVKDPVLKEKIRKATLANVELVEYLIPDRGQGTDKKARVQEALRRVFPSLAADLIADAIEEAVYSSDEVFKGAVNP